LRTELEAVAERFADRASEHYADMTPAERQTLHDSVRNLCNDLLDDWLKNTNTRTPTAVPTTAPSPTATPLPTALPTPCPLPGGIKHGLFTSPIAGEKSYRIYLPPCYGQDNHVYPVLYMLAGNTYTDAIWDQVGLDEAAEAGIQSGAYPPIIIVMPYSGETALYSSGGPNSYETVILEDLTTHIETTYCASSDPQFRALGGLSRGGYWALEIAFRHPDAFRSVGGHSAALLDEYAKPDVNPQYTALSNDLGDLRIYLDIGDQDWVRANTLQLHADMADANIPHTWVLNSGLHEEAYWEAHTAEYLTWYTEPWSPDRSNYPLCNLP
ncbi:MAG: alpha/beta hydrolase-fold protein, partial [Chloroflexota bacterium]